MGDVDPAFIQPPEFRPKLQNSIETDDEIPVIDLSTDHKQLVLDVGHACQKWGFFQVINHGVPSELKARIEKAAKEFFDQPIEEKQKVKRDEVHPMGYHDQEHTKNVRDWKEVFDFWLQDPTFLPASHKPDDKELRRLTNQWPEHPLGFR